MENHVLSNRIIKQVWVAIFLSGKKYFKQKLVKRDKEGNYTLIKEIIHREDLTGLEAWLKQWSTLQVWIPEFKSLFLIKKTWQF
jgi:hypothetical protein